MVTPDDARLALTVLEFLFEPEAGFEPHEQQAFDWLREFIKEHEQCAI